MAEARGLGHELGEALDGALDHVDVRRRASAVLRRHVGFDVAVWATVDPGTVMWTSCVLDGMERDPALEGGVFANEYGQVDVLKLVDLARTRRPATLDGATGGRPDRSTRYRELLAPAGFRDELRLVLTDGTTPWGAVVLLRSGSPFGAPDLRATASVGRPVALALRAAVTASWGGVADGASGVGLLLCRADGSIAEVTDEARTLLGAWADCGADGPTGRGDLPQVVSAVVAAHAAGELGSAIASTPEGRWLRFTATRFAGATAVVVERLPAAQLADVVVRGRGLTRRERDVLTLVARGRSNREVARALALSEHTVADHVKVLFAKFGVLSRSELTAALFAESFAPLHASVGTG